MHFWFQTRNQIIRSALANYTSQFGSHYRVLEVGCGTGNVLRHLKQICKNGLVIGMDLFPEGLHYAKKRVACPLVQADMRQHPFAIGFQMIGLFDVLEHLEDDTQTLINLHRMLETRGILILTVPAHAFLWSYFDQLSHHYRRYTITDLNEKLLKAGFKIEYATYFMSLLLPWIWLGRKLNQLFSSNRNLKSSEDITALSMRDLYLSRAINNLMSGLLRFESRQVFRHRQIPFGASLLVIARKE